MPHFPFHLCLITDPLYLLNKLFREKIIEALDGGVDMIQYRNLSGTKEEKIHQAKTLRELTRDKEAALIINRDPWLAEAVQADGVQLGAGTIPGPDAKILLGKSSLIGFSVHNTMEIKKAESFGADFLILSPLFPPGSKDPAPTTLGVDEFSGLCRLTSLPIFALGGINPGTAPIAMQAGAHGLAAISGILAAPSVFLAAKKMRQIVDGDFPKH